MEAILDAAASIFTDTDIASATTRQIADRAGVGVGSLYEYYANKDALVRALVVRFADELKRGVDAIFDARVDEPIEIMIPRLTRSVIELYDHNPLFYARLIRIVSFIPGENPFDTVEAPIRERFATLLAACIEEATIDIDKVALLIVHALRRLIEAACADDRIAINLKEIEAELVTLTLSYLQSSTRVQAVQ